METTSKRVLITGIGGAIGAHMFAHVMHNTDWHVIGVDSFRHKGYISRLVEMLRAHPDWNDRWHGVTHDLTVPFDRQQMAYIGDVDYVINLASLSDVQDSIDNPRPFVENNVAIMLTMLEAARVWEPEVFLHFSTDEVYGPTPRHSGGHDEWDPILPSNPYAASKAAQEAIAISYWRSFGIPLVITNTMNNFGEMQGTSKFPARIQALLKAGKHVRVHTSATGEIGTRYYIHSRNVADAVLFLLQRKPHLHDPGFIDKPDRFNIVGDRQVSNEELVFLIANIMGVEPKMVYENFHDDNPGHDLHYGLNGAKLDALGWVPPVSFEESMRSVVEWTEDRPEWQAGQE